MTIKITKEIFIANPTNKIKWNHRKQSIQKKAEKEENGTNNTENE